MRYLLITFYRKPNGQIDEHVAISKRVRTSDVSTSNIIMDFGKNTIDKCVVEGKKLDKPFQELRDYYHKIYPNLIEQLEKEGPIAVKQREKTK